MESIITALASYGIYAGGEVGELFSNLEQMGFFSYLLPFLLVFALVNGILTKTKIFDDKAVNGIIAFAVGLLALQFDFVPVFFSEIFPRLGVGLAIILVIIILVGSFLPKTNWAKYTIFGIAAVILIFVLSSTADALGWTMGQVLRENLGTFLGGLVIIILFAIAANAGSEKTSDIETPWNPWGK